MRIRLHGQFFWKVPLHVASSLLFIFDDLCRQTRAADPSTLHEVITVLDDIAQSGFTAVRCWAFNDGPRWNSLQPEPGCYNDDVFAGLDRVIFEAGRRGLRVLLCLTDYWEHFGGMKQYVEWSRRSSCDNNLIPLHEQDTFCSDEFYESQWCQARFQQFVASVLNRKNSITGVKYCEDPAILGWAPANEPRCPSDEDCHRQTVARWIHSISQFIKTIDSNHIIFADLEGWYGPSIPELYSQNPLGCSKGTGCDWFLECSSPYVDVACIHLYPDSWLPSENEQTKLEFTLKWIADHANIAKIRLRKPMALTEFGKKPCSSQIVPNARTKWYESVLNQCASLMLENSGLAGIMVWMAAAPSYPGMMEKFMKLNKINNFVAS